MVNDNQLQLAKDILNFIDSENGSVSKYQIFKEFSQPENNSKEIYTAISFLENHYNVIEFFTTIGLIGGEIENYRITPNGYKALKIGLDKYIKKKEKSPNKKSEIISIIALVLASIQPGIALKNLMLPENKTENSDYQSENRNKQSSTFTISEQVFDKLKDSIKHDTVFLNELKIELKENSLNDKITTP